MFFVLAVLSKSITMTLPAALLIIDIYPLRRLKLAPSEWLSGPGRRVLLEKVPFLIIAAIAACVSYWAVARHEFFTSTVQYPLPARLVMALYSVCFYIGKTILPVGLSALYELPPRVDPFACRFLGPELALVVATAALVAGRRMLPGALAAWVYSALLVLPVSGAVIHAGVQLVSDRYAYLSGLGFAVLAGGSLAWFLSQRARVSSGVVVAGAVAAVLVVAGWGAGAWRQSRLWVDSEALWRRAVEVEPHCAVCALNLGAVLVERAQGDPGRAIEAEERFRRAIALRPDRAWRITMFGDEIEQALFVSMLQCADAHERKMAEAVKLGRLWLHGRCIALVGYE